MNNKMDQTSAGLNQIMEIINAKGDEGELKQIIDKSKPHSNHKTDKK